jgi:hypothetical protein
MLFGRHYWPFLLLGGVSLVAMVGGCAFWKEEASAPPSLPVAKMSTDSVTLEIAFVRMSGEAQARQDEIWRSIDEQQLPSPIRVCLHQNGMRMGICGSQMPPLLRTLLDEKADPLAVAGGGFNAGGDVTATQRQLQTRAGKRGVILTGSPREELTLLMQHDGALTGQTFHNAQCLFAVKAFPQGDGRVRIELVPEIEHGATKQRWVGQEGMFHPEAGKEHKIVGELKMELVLSPGEVIVASCSADQKGIGKQFFASGAAGEQKVLLIRLAQTQYDDVFAPEKLQAPIATPLD